MMTTIDAAKIQKPTQVSSSRLGVHVVEVAQGAGGEHERDVHDDEQQEPDHHQEVQRPRHLDAEHRADHLNFVDSAGDMPRPVMSASGAAMKTVTK